MTTATAGGMGKPAMLALATLVLIVTSAACGSDGGGEGSVGSSDPTNTESMLEGSVLVFAAASLADAFGEIESAFEAANPAVDLQLNLAGSSSLREQILEGAPADVFASANQTNMDPVVEAGDVVGTAKVFASNLLEIAVPAGNPGEIAGLGDFANAEALIGLCAEGVPCGDFAREVFANVGVEPSIDTNEPDVRALLTKISVGELDAGIVYVTDVLAAGDQVEGIVIPRADNVAARYPIAQLAAAPNPDGAAVFVAFVLSAEGQSILASYGFDAS